MGQTIREVFFFQIFVSFFERKFLFEIHFLTFSALMKAKEIFCFQILKKVGVYKSNSIKVMDYSDSHSMSFVISTEGILRAPFFVISTGTEG